MQQLFAAGREIYTMYKTLSLHNTLKISAVLLLLAVLLLMFPGQAAGLGHDARLVEISGVTDESAGFAARVESPDMILARLAGEGAVASAVARVESPDMFIARYAAEQTGTAAPTAVGPAVTGISYWALILILTLSIILALVLLSWERLFKLRQADVDRVTSRCTLIGEGC